MDPDAVVGLYSCFAVRTTTGTAVVCIWNGVEKRINTRVTGIVKRQSKMFDEVCLLAP